MQAFSLSSFIFIRGHSSPLFCYLFSTIRASGSGRSAGQRDRLPTPIFLGFLCGSAGREAAWNVGDLGSIPELGRSPGEGKGYPLQYSGLDNSIDCIVHVVAKSRTWLSDFYSLSIKSNRQWPEKEERFGSVIYLLSICISWTLSFKICYSKRKGNHWYLASSLAVPFLFILGLILGLIHYLYYLIINNDRIIYYHYCYNDIITLLYW